MKDVKCKMLNVGCYTGNYEWYDIVNILYCYCMNCSSYINDAIISIYF